MKDIEDIADDIRDELDDAEKYALRAMKFKDKYPDVAQHYYRRSLEEMEHASGLHTDGVTIIENYQREHGDPPAPMQAIYDYLHKQNIERAAKVKAIQSMF